MRGSQRVQRVCLIHSFKGFFFRRLLESFLRLSPACAGPVKMFHASEGDEAMAWAEAWPSGATAPPLPRRRGRRAERGT